MEGTFLVLRIMNLVDVDSVMELTKEHFDSVNMVERGYSYVEADTRQYVEMVAESDDYTPIVSVNENQEVEGVLFFQINRSPYNNEELHGIEHAWYVKRSLNPVKRAKLFMKLLKEGTRTLETLGVRLIIISLPSATGIGVTVGNFLKRNGFKYTENIYRRRF